MAASSPDAAKPPVFFYTYDAEGRVCALNGPQGMIGYQYDADGNRVGKGTVTTIATCDITANGYQPMTDFVLDQSGGQMTEMAVYTTSAGTQYQHVHSNVTAGGALIASFDTTGYGLHFYLTDALGSRRVQTDPAGIPEQTCQSLPFGDQLYCTGSPAFPTEHHFTCKERDTESDLDYFGARYLSSSMGRWTSPDFSDDPDPVPWANLGNPQSLNLYAYVNNNPLTGIDDDGHVDCQTKTQDVVCIVQTVWNWLTAQPGPQAAVGAYKELSNEGNDFGRLMDRLPGTPTLHTRPPNMPLQNNWQRAGAAIAFAGTFFIPGAGEEEAMNLTGKWNSGTFASVEESLAYHFEKHGVEVGATNLLQYLRKADAFAADVQRTGRFRKIPLPDGSIKYIKNGRYIIKSLEGKILSFGITGTGA